MRIAKTPEALRRLRAEVGAGGVGFVPTLGGLHAGHRSLIERSLADNATTVLSIFLNPTQFDNSADLEAYPASVEADRDLARQLGVDILFCPQPAEIYPRGFRYRVSEEGTSATLEGAHRPGHFDGVLTVVLKLLNLVRPDRAYFGEKDHQQLELVRGMVGDFFLDVEVVACPTVRAADGLALSSRNRLLTPTQRALAAHFPAVLAASSSAEEAAGELAGRGFEVDYVTDVDGRRYGAVRLGDVRLIDNLELASRARGAA